MRRRLSVQAEIQIGDSSFPFSVKGHDAWALLELIKEGPEGCTPIDNPGPCWSAYVFNLRQLGLVIETKHEGHTGPFPGSHARYILKSRVRVIDSNLDLEAA